MLQENQQPKPAKLFDLKYRNKTEVTGQPYPICVARKNDLLKTNYYLAAYFSITPHKQPGQ